MKNPLRNLFSTRPRFVVFLVVAVALMFAVVVAEFRIRGSNLLAPLSSEQAFEECTPCMNAATRILIAGLPDPAKWELHLSLLYATAKSSPAYGALADLKPLFDSRRVCFDGTGESFLNGYEMGIQSASTISAGTNDAVAAVYYSRLAWTIGRALSSQQPDERAFRSGWDMGFAAGNGTVVMQ